MWEFMNDMANGMKKRMMPRRRGMNAMTAMVLGASVGIAAWETVRRTRMNSSGTSLEASKIANEVLSGLDE